MAVKFLLSMYASIIVFPAFAHAKCWWKVSNQVVPMESVAGAPTFVCGGNTDSKFQRCCVQGDTCLQGSICHFTHQSVFGSGYYIGGCTDEDYDDPICSPRCSETLPSNLNLMLTLVICVSPQMIRLPQILCIIQLRICGPAVHQKI